MLDYKQVFSSKAQRFLRAVESIIYLELFNIWIEITIFVSKDEIRWILWIGIAENDFPWNDSQSAMTSMRKIIEIHVTECPPYGMTNLNLSAHGPGATGVHLKKRKQIFFKAFTFIYNSIL
jgi:hypothetical protein